MSVNLATVDEQAIRDANSVHYEGRGLTLDFFFSFFRRVALCLYGEQIMTLRPQVRGYVAYRIIFCPFRFIQISKFANVQATCGVSSLSSLVQSSYRVHTLACTANPAHGLSEAASTTFSPHDKQMLHKIYNSRIGKHLLTVPVTQKEPSQIRNTTQCHVGLSGSNDVEINVCLLKRHALTLVNCNGPTKNEWNLRHCGKRSGDPVDAPSRACEQYFSTIIEPYERIQSIVRKGRHPIRSIALSNKGEQIRRSI